MVLALTPLSFNLDCRMTASTPFSAGARFREALAAESPLQVIGAINANHALLAKRAGFRAIYLSGGGVAAGSLGLPDLASTPWKTCWWTCAASPMSATCR